MCHLSPCQRHHWQRQYFSINHCHVQCFWQEVILRSPVFETCFVLTLCAPKVAFIPVLWCKTESVTAHRKVSITTFLWIHVHCPLFLHLPSTNWKTQKFQFLHLTFEYLQKMRDLNVGIIFSPVHKNPMQPEEEKCSSSN